MSDMERIESLIFVAIDNVNELLPAGSALEKKPTEVLTGAGSKLDSMGMVNFVFAVENEISRQYGLDLNLADAKSMDGSEPMETVGSLTNYLFQALHKAR